MSKWKDRDRAWSKHLDELATKWVGIPVPVDALEPRHNLNRCKCEVKTMVVHVPFIGLYGSKGGWTVQCHVCDGPLLHWGSRLWAYDLELHFNPREKYHEH